MPPNLGHLRTFLAVIDTGSLAGASRQLFRVQSAITRAIHELEGSLDTTLFQRTPAGVVLTPAAEAILPRVRSVMRDLSIWGRRKSAEAQADDLYRNVPAAVLNNKRLDIFCRLLRSRHMPTVASQVGVSQPAVSAAISLLEECAQDKLFLRTARGLTPTPRAVALGQTTRHALNDLARLASDIAAAHGTLAGEVAVGALPLSRSSLLPEAIAQLVAAEPGVQVSTVESPFDDLCAALRAGSLDFIVGALRDARYATDLEVHELFAEPLAIIVGGHHPLAAKRRVSLAALAGHQWILPRRDTPSRALLAAAFATAGQAEPVPSVETGDSMIVRGLLARSAMLAVVSQGQMTRELRSGEVKALPIELAGTARPIGIIRRAGVLASPPAAALFETIRAIANRPRD
ncbi:LysR family transcriptional regulator [Burkholderia gladioli]|uniref:LysR family transcriptional regulator n=1 Tax=Burkholderia gladioli TaxID=28095 RepID=UPI00163F624F|nr:LysR family transcriptional regulator [Burkholderia gladioli]